MILRDKKELDKFAKTPQVKLPVYKANKKLNVLEVVDEKDWAAFIESNRGFTLQEMIEKNIYLSSGIDMKYVDISDVPTSLNEIFKESKIDSQLQARLSFIKDKALKEKQLKLQEKIQENVKSDKEVKNE